MKILFLQDDFPPKSFGGAGISTYELALGMKEAGHDVSVITACQKKEEEEDVDYNGLRVFKIFSDYPLGWRWYVSINNRPVVRRVEKVLRKVRPDIVHAHNIHTHLSYACLKTAKKYAKVVITFRDVMAFNFSKLNTKQYLENFDVRTTWLDHLKQARKSWNPLRNFFIRKYLDYADAKFAISNALKNALGQNGIGGVEVIHNGIQAGEWRVSSEAVQTFKRHQGLENKKVIFFNGRLSPAKGAPQALEALSLIRKDVPEATLLVSGVGEMVSRENVIFAGWLDREEVKLAYTVSDVVLMPSVCLDAFGRVNIEAMAAKKPVVGTCYGGTPEIVKDGVTGYIINPLYPEQIAEKTLEFLKDPGKAKKFGEEGYERVKVCFNLEDKVKEYINVYKSLLK